MPKQILFHIVTYKYWSKTNYEKIERDCMSMMQIILGKKNIDQFYEY